MSQRSRAWEFIGDAFLCLSVFTAMWVILTAVGLLTPAIGACP